MWRNPAGHSKQQLNTARTAAAERDGRSEVTLAAGTLLGLTSLIVFLVLLVGPLFAEPASAASAEAEEPSRTESSDGQNSAAPAPSPAVADPASNLPPVGAAPRTSVPNRTLDELLVVRVRRVHDDRSDAERADDSIAAAVNLGSDPDLLPRNPFRKRSTDLFRTEREVEIGQQEMLVRLRLRAKSRETMSVELRF